LTKLHGYIQPAHSHTVLKLPQYTLNLISNFRPLKYMFICDTVTSKLCLKCCHRSHTCQQYIHFKIYQWT